MNPSPKHGVSVITFEPENDDVSEITGLGKLITSIVANAFVK